jgi:DNA-binding phage protein
MHEGNEAGRRMASRIRRILGHTTRYAFDGRARLMEDAGLSRSEVTRLLSGDCNPSYRVVLSVLEALERELGFRVDPRDVLSYSGRFDRTVCEVVRCRGCPDCRPYRAPSGLRAGDSAPLTIPTDPYDR